MRRASRRCKAPRESGEACRSATSPSRMTASQAARSNGSRPVPAIAPNMTALIDRARLARRGFHVERDEAAAERARHIEQPVGIEAPVALRHLLRGRERARRRGDERRAVGAHEAVGDHAAGLEELGGDEEIDATRHRDTATAPAPRKRRMRAPEGSRRSTWSRRSVAQRRESRCSARESPRSTAASTSHSASTPPPSPPEAAIRIETTPTLVACRDSLPPEGVQ